MNIIFFGTPSYVIPILEALHKKYNTAKEQELIGVITQDPKPSGRKKLIMRTDVDNWAYKHNIDVAHNFEDIPEADLGIVASYGKIIPKSVISKFKFGILNIHPSLLPKHRGAAPVQATISAGEKNTGVTIIKMDEKMDHGPIVSVLKAQVRDDDTTESLRNRLFETSTKFLINLIPAYLSGKTKLRPQNHSEATFTKLITKDDALISPKSLKLALKGKTKKVEEIEHLIRAMNPWPTAWTKLTLEGQEKRLKIIKAHLKDDKLVIEKVQLEGKKEVTWKQFLAAYPRAI